VLFVSLGAHLSLNDDGKFDESKKLDVSWILIISIGIPIDFLLLIFTRSLAHNDYYTSINNNEHCCMVLSTSISNAISTCRNTCEQCWVHQNANKQQTELQALKHQMEVLILMNQQALVNNHDFDEQKVMSLHPLPHSASSSSESSSEIEMERVSNTKNPNSAIPMLRLNYCYHCGAQQHIPHPRYCYACGKKIGFIDGRGLDKVTNILKTHEPEEEKQAPTITQYTNTQQAFNHQPQQQQVTVAEKQESKEEAGDVDELDNQLPVSPSGADFDANSDCISVSDRKSISVSALHIHPSPSDP